MLETMSDWWLSQGVDLRQPKQEIGDYVESQGFLVPRRFDNFEDALGAVETDAITVIIRSEHPDQYDGPSGLIDSYIINQEAILRGQAERQRLPNLGEMETEIVNSRSRNWFSTPRQDEPGYAQIEHVIIGDAPSTDSSVTMDRLRAMALLAPPVQRYQELTGQSSEIYKAATSFSYWEYVPGLNVTIAADDVVDNQYHILAWSDDDIMQPTYRSASIVNESGEAKCSYMSDGSDIDPRLTKNITELYENVRNLPRFASQHCPIMELQVDERGQIWFLQYHKSRDFDLSIDRLDVSDFSQEDGWNKADAVRGALDQLTTVHTALWYPDNYGSVRENVIPVPEHEEGSFDWGYDVGLSEVLSRRRTVFFTEDDFTRLYNLMTNQHESRSRWFKPKVGLGLGKDIFGSVITEDIKEKVTRRIQNNKMARVAIDVVSDGVDGYVRLNPDNEQPIDTDN